MLVMMGSLGWVNKVQEVSKGDMMMIVLRMSLGELVELLLEIALVMAMMMVSNLFQGCLGLIL